MLIFKRRIERFVAKTFYSSFDYALLIAHTFSPLIITLTLVDMQYAYCFHLPPTTTKTSIQETVSLPRSLTSNGCITLCEIFGCICNVIKRHCMMAKLYY